MDELYLQRECPQTHLLENGLSSSLEVSYYVVISLNKIKKWTSKLVCVFGLDCWADTALTTFKNGY